METYLYLNMIKQNEIENKVNKKNQTKFSLSYYEQKDF